MDKKAQDASYYQRNKKRLRAKSLAYAASPHGRAMRKANYHKNRKKFLIKSREYYAENREQACADSRAYYQRQKASRGTPRRRAQIVLASCRTRAKHRGLRFDLTREWIQTRLELGKCELSGATFDLVLSQTGRALPMAPSIDRIDNRKGYTQDNCRVILWCLNRALGEEGEDFMLPIWQRVLERKK